jgi:hypothetical protein
MQKVEGSNPFSRFGEGLHLQVFSSEQSPSASASCRTETGLAADRIGGGSTKSGLFAGGFSLVRTEVILQGLQKVERSSAAAVGRLFLHGSRIKELIDTAVRGPAGGIFIPG